MSSNVRRIASVFLLLAGLLVGGCATTSADNPSARTGADATLIAAAKSAITAANADWPGAMRSRNATTLAAAYAETGALITASGKAINGRAAIERYYREAFQNSPPIVDGEIVDEGIVTSGNLVYVWGHGNYTVEKTPGQPSSNSGYFLSVWQADASGAWKIVRHLTF